MVLNVNIVETRFNYAIGVKTVGRFLWKRKVYVVGKWDHEIDDYRVIHDGWLNERQAKRLFNRRARVKRVQEILGFTWVLT